MTMQTYEDRINEEAELLSASCPSLSIEEKYYVYALLDPRSPGEYCYAVGDRTFNFGFEPFYVGKGTGKRMYKHVTEAKVSRKATRKLNKIRAIMGAGEAVIAERVSGFESEAVTLALEKLLIASVGKQADGRGPLTNDTDGGEGLNPSTETRKILKASATNAWKRYTDAQKEAVRNRGRNALLGKTEAQLNERRNKIGDAAKIFHAGLTEEEKRDRADVNSKLAREQHKAMSDDMRKHRSGVISEGNKAAWSKKTPEEIAARAAKKRATLDAMPFIVCPKCDAKSKYKGFMEKRHFDNCTKG